MSTHKLAQIDQISKDYERLKLIKNTDFARIVLKNMKSLYEARQVAKKLRELPTTETFITYDSAIQALYERHVMRDENGDIHMMENNQPKIKDLEALNADLKVINEQHPVAVGELEQHEANLRKGFEETMFTLEDFPELLIPDDLDTVNLEIVLRYVA